MARMIDADRLIEKLKNRLYDFKEARRSGTKDIEAIYYRELETIYTIAVIDATAEEETEP